MLHYIHGQGWAGRGDTARLGWNIMSRVLAQYPLSPAAATVQLSESSVFTPHTVVAL